MKITKLFQILLSVSALHAYSQVGIGTENPHPSALLELKADHKGFKGPGIPLTNRYDITTIPNAVRGLIVFNTQNSGVKPNEVYANRYYFWNGTEWISLPGVIDIESLIQPKIFFAQQSDTQEYPSSNYDGTVQVTFSGSLVNTDNFITFDNPNDTFKINIAGTYEISSYINYNPKGDSDHRALQNLKIQKRIGLTGAWVDIAGTRGSWGEGAASDYKTLVLPITAVYLNEGDYLRVVTLNPYTSGDSVQGKGVIGTFTNSPVSKALSIKLVDYNF